jgi:pilus assembly protein Flp/PilA
MKELIAGAVNFMKCEDGQGMVEYGLIIGLIAIALIGALVIFAPQIAGVFERAGDQLDAAQVTTE